VVGAGTVVVGTVPRGEDGVRVAMLAPLAFLLVLTDAAVAAPHPGLLAGLAAALVVVALAAVRRVPTAAGAPATAVAERARRRALDRGAPPRQHDPDAAGHRRPRAPSRPSATVATT
jgi:hypothetical protein